MGADGEWRRFTLAGLEVKEPHAQISFTNDHWPSVTTMRLSILLSVIVIVFSVVHNCNAQETESLSTGERLRRVEELLQDLRSKKEPNNINILRRVEAELQMIIKTDPLSVFKSQIEADLDFVNERIAHHDLLVAAFYMNRGHGLRGASSRLRGITQHYPKFSKMDEVLFRLSVVSMAQEQEEDAIRYSWTLICHYPNSEYVPKAFDQIHSIGVRSWEGCHKYKE